MKEFSVYHADDRLAAQIQDAATAYAALLEQLCKIGMTGGREYSLVVTKLQEAFHWTIDGLARASGLTPGR